jgi:hypothetical protein
MGLDWLPGNKAKPGFEAEFTDLFGRLDACGPGGERDALLERFREISASAFETLGAPVVGRDPAADAWARQMYRELDERDQSEDEFLVHMAGFAVLPLVPRCDGLPRYSNGSPGGYVEEYSFRAQFLHDCADDIGADLLDAAYESKLPEDMLVYGRQLLAKAEDLAARHGLNPTNLVVPDEIPTEEEFAAGKRAPETWSVEHRVDVAHSAGRWCVFWAERGHLLDAWW